MSTSHDYFLDKQSNLGPMSYNDWKAANSSVFFDLRDMWDTSYSEREKWMLYEQFISGQGLPQGELNSYLAQEPEWGDGNFLTNAMSDIGDTVNDVVNPIVDEAAGFWNEHGEWIAPAVIAGGTAYHMMNPAVDPAAGMSPGPNPSTAYGGQGVIEGQGGASVTGGGSVAGGAAASASNTLASDVSNPMGSGFTGTATNSTVEGLTGVEALAAGQLATNVIDDTKGDDSGFWDSVNDVLNFNEDGEFGGLLDLISAVNQVNAADNQMEGIDEYTDAMNAATQDYIDEVNAGYDDALGATRYGYNKAISETRDQLGLTDELFQPYLDLGERSAKQMQRGSTIGGYDRRLERIMGTDSFKGLRDERMKDMGGHLSNVGLSRSGKGLQKLSMISPELAMEIEGTLYNRAAGGAELGANAAGNKASTTANLNQVLTGLLTGRADANSDLHTSRADAIAKANLTNSNASANLGLASANTWDQALQNILNLYTTQGKYS